MVNPTTEKNGNEANLSSQDPRIGVFICRCGGNISDVVDVEAVANAIGKINGVVTAQVHSFMCSDPGQNLIIDEIKRKQLNRIVVASCSPFLHELTFRNAVQRGGLNPYLYEHVNIREQCSWAHHSDPAGATTKAIRLIAGAVNSVRYANPLNRIKIRVTKQVLVIGGGIAGIKAAAELARQGIPVVLLEESSRLGGHVIEHNKLYPTEIDAPGFVESLSRQILNNPLVKIYYRAHLEQVSGFIGNFEVTISSEINGDKNDNNSVPLSGLSKTIGTRLIVGAIIIATGYDSYKPYAGEYGYGDSRVITLPEFIKLLRDQRSSSFVHRGRIIKNVGFIHCVGSRQIEGVHKPQSDGKVNNYCSRTCCTAILQQAVELKKRYPDLNVFDFHQDIRTYGRDHEQYYIQASKCGVIFFRFHGDELPEVHSLNGSYGALAVVVKDWLTFGEEVQVPLDLIVLGVGMIPRDIHKIIDLLKLPVGNDRFLQEVHPKLRPVEVSINGVFLAGTAQSPMNVEETLNAASAAASKVSALLCRDIVELDPFIANVDQESCIGCQKCFNECEYPGALLEDEVLVNGKTVKKARVNPGLCVGCGACVAVCPTRCINLAGWTLRQFDAYIDGLMSDTSNINVK